MANGLYGTTIPASMSNADISNYVDIFYSYSPTQNSSDVEPVKLQKLDAENLRCAESVDSSGTTSVLEGLFNLKLPTNIFGKKGFYTIYIKPKEVKATIMDVSTLKDFSTVRGIVLDTTKLDSSIMADAKTNNGLVGYRVIYLNEGERSNIVRFVTSNNLCQPVASISLSTEAKSYAYQYNENSTYTFLTLTPSMSLSFKPSTTPYIGKATQEILLVNTFFEPIQLDIEMVEHDAETISTLLEGSQLRDLDNGLITTFDKNGNIFSQSEVSTLKETATGTPQYELKEHRINNIDFSQTISDKIEG